MRSGLLAIVAGAAVGLAGCGDLTQTKDGEYTILLKAFAGPGHVEEANRYKAETQSRTDWEGMYAVHEENQSELFWGKYATAEAAGRNLGTAREFAPVGIKAYPIAIVVPVPGQDIGPPEWNLRNAKGRYTVVVAKYYNLPPKLLSPAYARRREDAVEYCTELRKSGFEAYFLLEPRVSYVTIGTFPASAVVSAGPGQFPGAIRDKGMQAILQQYPKLSLNAPGVREYIYIKNPRTGKEERITSASYPMEIPGSEESPRPGGEQRYFPG